MPLNLSPTQVAFNARGDGKFNQPFSEQVAFFRDKLNLPTERYDDILNAAHDRAFVVAGAMKADLLDDLHQAVDKAIEQGKSIQWFRQNFDGIVAKHGWQGWTGSDTQKGRDWRTRVIYQTNMSTSYAAGRYKQLTDPDLLSRRPYWKYVHNDTVRFPRLIHKSWHGVVLRYDDLWWQTHFPPNGWGCRCRITAVPESEYKGLPAPVIETYLYKGVYVPKGIDYGWDYAPGASVAGQMKPFIDDKVKKLPPPLAKALVEDVVTLKSKVFVPQANSKAAAQWAVDNDLVNVANYGKVDVSVANDMNQSLFEHINEFPELRKNQKFVGTCQNQFNYWYEKSINTYAQRLIDKGYDAESAKLLAARYVKKPKVSGSTWMHSWSQPDASGIAVNEKWGKDLAAFNRSLIANVESTYHPLFCDTVKSCVDHELGHQLEDLLGLARNADMIALYKEALKLGISEQLSGYAGKNIKEFIAEAWAESKNNPSPRRFAEAVARIIRNEYKQRFT